MRRLPSPVRPSARVALLVAVAAALSGCFQMANLITVRADGSGTVTETVTLSEQALAFAAMADSSETGLADPATLEARAAALGPGVRLLSVEETATGYTASYAFARVADLRYTPPTAPLGGEDTQPDSAETAAPFTFAFVAGDGGAPHMLVVTIPEAEDAPALATDTAAVDPAEQQQSLAMARALLGDARVTVQLAVDGEIAETDAHFRDGDVLTLLDIQMGAVFDLVAEHPEWMQGQQPSLAELAGLAGDREDLRIQLPGTVTIRFE